MSRTHASSLLVTALPGLGGQLAARLSGEPGIVVTRTEGDRIAVVLETAAAHNSVATYQRIVDLQEVETTNVAYTGLAPEGMSRRSFLESLAVTTLALSAAGGGSQVQAAGKEKKWIPDSGATKWNKTVCRFCGTGCGVMAGVEDGKVVAVRGDELNPVNKGLLCVKGYHLPGILYGKDRLTTPLIRRNGKLQPATWDEALDLIASKMKTTVEKHGKNAIGMYGSGQWTIVEGYAALKLFKGGIGTDNVEANARLCMASAVTGFMTTFGSDEPMGCYDDFEHGDTFVLWGNNMAEMHPVLFSRILERRRKSSWVKIIDIGTRRTRTTRFADQYIPIKPGTDLALANGIAHLLVKNDAVDKAFVEEHVTLKKGLTQMGYGLEDGYQFKDKPESISFDDYVAFLADYTPEKVSATTGIPVSTIQELAKKYGDKSRGVVSLWCMGVNQHSRGTWMNNLIYNLHLLTGKISKKGSGPLSLTGQPSACGTVREVGTVAARLPADTFITNPEHRKKAAEIWGVPVENIPDKPGLHTIAMFRALARGDLKFVWVQCTNPFVTLPNQARYRKAFESGEAFMVVSDVYPTETTALASVVLPSSMWIEKEGLFGNTERRTQQWNKLVEPPGQARDDLWQIVEIGKRLGHGKLFETGDLPLHEGLFEEYRKFGLGIGKDLASYSQYVENRGLRWPVVNGVETRWRYREGEDPYVAEGKGIEFYKNKKTGGRAVIWARPYEPPAEIPDKDYPFWLTTGRVLEHWHTGTMTRRVPELFGAVDSAYIEMNPEDALTHGLEAGNQVRIKSRRGEMVLPLKLRERSIPEKGSVFIPFFDETKLVNYLTLDSFCPISKEPDYKKCAVRVEKA